MRPSAARNEVNFCTEMLSAPLLPVDVPVPVDVLVLAAPVAVPAVGEPPLGAVLEGAAPEGAVLEGAAPPLAAARKAS
jgi:hypothetical protein